MIIKINGKEEVIENKLNLLELVKSRGLSPERIVIEHNLCIVPKEKWSGIILEDSDKIEIVSFVGGG